MKHLKNFSIKNFERPKSLPPKILFMFGFFLYFEGKGGPKHKEFMGSGVEGGGSWRGFMAKFFMFMPFWEA